MDPYENLVRQDTFDLDHGLERPVPPDPAIFDKTSMMAGADELRGRVWHVNRYTNDRCRSCGAGAERLVDGTLVTFHTDLCEDVPVLPLEGLS